MLVTRGRGVENKGDVVKVYKLAGKEKKIGKNGNPVKGGRIHYLLH